MTTIILKDEAISYNVESAAEATGMTTNRIKVAIRENRLPAKKDGRATIIRRHDLVDFINMLDDADGEEAS